MRWRFNAVLERAVFFFFAGAAMGRKVTALVRFCTFAPVMPCGRKRKLKKIKRHKLKKRRRLNRHKKKLR